VSELRRLPSVDLLLQNEQGSKIVAEYGRPITVDAIRIVLGDIRQKFLDGRDDEKLDHGHLLDLTESLLADWFRPSLIPVINATGVILHTNLGRAPLSSQAVQAISAASSGFSSLEFNLKTGRRGSRGEDVEALFRRLTGAEAALVVNNNAAALLLILTALARRKRVIIARSQMVEIGGGFRIPDVMKQSGAKLVEVGTTNQVHLHDYEEVLTQPAGMVLRAHHSNYKIIGFTSEVGLPELVQAAHKRGVLVLDDLGSGAFLDTARFGLSHEPMVQESLAAGADLVCFSGDKLLGGPQAGVILGRNDLVVKLRKHPLARALRADKLCLASLATTVAHYLKHEAERKIPVWAMISMTLDEIHHRAARWREVLREGEIIEGFSTVGGGSLPEETLPTWLFGVKSRHPEHFLAKLRASSPPVIARILTDQVVFDPRSILVEQETIFLSILNDLLSQ
jgi:L-seryl-tRNA(Ser) seleniumtransferase